MASLIAARQAKQDLDNIANDLVDDYPDEFERLSKFIDAATPQFENLGSKVGRQDRNGKKLRVGDTVAVYDSSRYGNPTGVVVGPADGVGSTGPRVTVRLDNGQNDQYTPSVGRVERTAKIKDLLGEVAA